ncbi:armadillo/beta-catenin/plakoglobin [Epithele typhae]|uniref:armadillo/beta-catenin/plakoglobin n=1 Tax=Epithele typhae TaxID=378194 RepID=UPI00200772DD|nr:armadillo/beta-catenin/plakoglobin [Epithele typhae]KAH9945379.1 armadillo/beta-catenin/plakoglobin [Epithele typhae]
MDGPAATKQLSPLVLPTPSASPPLYRTGIPTRGPSPHNETTLQAKKNTILKSHGRPPWYDEDGHATSDAFVIGIAGGSASGKTHVARQIVQALGSIPTVVILSQDSFYKEHSPADLALAFANRYDFDHPDAIDMPLFAACLADLKAGNQTNIPIYSFTEHQRLPETKYLYGASIIIGQFIIFVQCDSDLMLSRRIRRDIKERGRSVEGVLEQYLRFVKPAYDNFVQPTSRYANIIVPGSDNTIAIELIATHIHRKIAERTNYLRKSLARAVPKCLTPGVNPDQYFPNVRLLPSTPQMQGIFTLLRDRDTSREDFIFFSDRLATLLSEAAMEYLPFKLKDIVTPISATYHGQQLAASHICGVSILRSGGPLEHGLRRVIQDINMGSLLIQSENSTGEPLLLHLMLPYCIRQRHLAQSSFVFLLDAQIGTGAAAFMAIRVLLDHGVPEKNIIFVAFIVASPGGIRALQRAFPEVRVVCGAIDPVLRDAWATWDTLETVDSENTLTSPAEEGGRKVWVVEPGMGHIGDRYYL